MSSSEKKKRGLVQTALLLNVKQMMDEGRRATECPDGKKLVNGLNKTQEAELPEQESAGPVSAQEDKQPPKPDKWTSGQQDKWTSGHLSGQLSGQLSEQVDKWTSGQLSEQVDKWATGQVDNRTSGQQDKWTSEQVARVDLSKKPKDLNLNQYQLLHALYFKRPFKQSGPDGIGVPFNIPYGTVRNSLRSLAKKGYITPCFSINDGVNKGTTCRVDSERCFELFGPTPVKNSEQVDNRTTGQVDNRTSGQVDNRTGGQVDTSYSSSKLLKNLLTSVREALDTNLELKFWKSHDLQPGKVVGWMEEFSRDFESMMRQLAYAAYQWGGETPGKKIKNHESAFYGALKKGGFSRPAGYESPQERQVRMESEELKRQERLLAELEASRKKREELEMKILFEKIMADPEGEAYKQLFDSLNDFEKKRASHPKKKSDVMWAAFKRKRG